MLNKQSPKSSLSILCLVILLGLISAFSVSGFATSIGLIPLCVWGAVFVFIWVLLTPNKNIQLLPRGIGWILTIVAIIMLIGVVFNYKRIAQLANYITLYGIVLWTLCFYRVDWLSIDLKNIGYVSLLMGLFFSFSFLPDRWLGGWNSNSAIVTVPLALFGAVILWMRGGRWLKILVLFSVFFLFEILWELQNRSAQLAIIIFFFLLFFDKPVVNRRWFRLFYVSVILLNVLIPLFVDVIGQSDWTSFIFDTSAQISDKAVGFNGREEVWEVEKIYIATSPILGHNGLRHFYPHNFSMDVLCQWGWLGWCFFMVCIISILEKAFLEDSPYNLYLCVFVVLILMNTFENSLLSNEVFTIFPFLFLSVPLCLNRYRLKKKQ